MLKTNRHKYSWLGGLLLLTSCCFIISQIIGLTCIVNKEQTQIEMWDYIYTGINLFSLFILLICLVGIFLLHLNRTGKLGIIGYLIAFAGTVLIAGDAWFEAFVVPFLSSVSPQIAHQDPSGSLIVGALISFSLFSIGWITVGISMYKSRIVPRYISLMIICGGVFGFKALTIPYLGVLAIAIGLLGIWLYKLQSTKQNIDGQFYDVSSS
ncbi:hypothetical protein D3C86_1239140 [compost metagenome]